MTLARERSYDEIVAIIREEERLRGGRGPKTIRRPLRPIDLHGPSSTAMTPRPSQYSTATPR